MSKYCLGINNPDASSNLKLFSFLRYLPIFSPRRGVWDINDFFIGG